VFLLGAGESSRSACRRRCAPLRPRSCPICAMAAVEQRQQWLSPSAMARAIYAMSVPLAPSSSQGRRRPVPIRWESGSLCFQVLDRGRGSRLQRWV